MTRLLLVAAVIGALIVPTPSANAQTDVHQYYQNLQRDLGERDDKFILIAQHIASKFHERQRMTDLRMREFADRYHELITGWSARLAQALPAFGPGGEAMLRRLQWARANGWGAEKTRQEILLPWYAKQSETVRRRLVARGITGDYDFAASENERDAYLRGDYSALMAEWSLNNVIQGN